MTFERPTTQGFDSYVVELPSYEVVLEDGNYTAEEKKVFMEIVDIKYIFGQMKSM